MVIGIPATNQPVQLADKFKRSGINSPLNSKRKSSKLFQDFKMVILSFNYLIKYFIKESIECVKI